MSLKNKPRVLLAWSSGKDSAWMLHTLRQSNEYEYDESFLDDLPDNIDPCGENGEFHSYAYCGPMFEKEISIEVGEVVTRDGFVFADLLPKW